MHVAALYLPYMYMCWTALMKLETAVHSMPFCSGPPGLFMYIKLMVVLKLLHDDGQA